MIKLVLLRHGESLWNKENRFTGWTDVGLSDKGIGEAKSAGRILKKKGFRFDIGYTSVLKRAIDTLNIVLSEMSLKIPVVKSWRLNERHYGALQGLNKAEIAQRYGEKQVLLWRRSFDLKPPELKISDSRYPGKDEMYKSLKKDELPLGESLKDTYNRVIPYWRSDVSPILKRKKKIIISAHGNSLRALVKHIDSISDKNILNLNIPTGVPLVYELDKNLKPLKHYYLEN